MNAQIRKLSVALTIMVLALMLALTYHQFIDAPTLNANDRNRRVTDAYWGKERGKIVAGKEILAESVPIGTKPRITYQRRYPKGAEYAHITGYFPAAVQGQVTQMEKEVGPVLSGKSDALWISRLQDLFIGSQPKGGNVSLTLNPKVQDAMRDALQGKTGAALALNPATGEILGMYSSPSFDPNALSSQNGKSVNDTYQKLLNNPSKPLVNRAISELYPPGSTFKIVTTAAALSSGAMQPDTLVEAPDALSLPGTTHQLVNYAGESCGNGNVTLTYAFAQSCNTAFGKIGMDLGGEALKHQAEAFGFGTSTRIPLPGVASEFPLPTAPSFLANAAIGQQSVRATPLQMAMVVQAVANHGKLLKPYLINQELSPDFQVLKQYAPQEIRQAISPEVADTLKEMMLEVVKSGSGRAAAIPGVAVAGKTGTAETGVGAGKDLWFVGFAPADNPQIALAIVVEDPQATMKTGGVNAAPLAAMILRAGVAK